MSHAAMVDKGPISTRQFMVVTGLILAFLATRLFTVLTLQLESVKFVINDISYYGANLYSLLEGQSDVMGEYPVPAVWILQSLYVAFGGFYEWTVPFMIVFILLDAAVTISFYRRDNAAGALFWIVFTGVQGAVVWSRFDLIPAALVAWACMLVITHPRIAGGLVGLGAAIKLWPALLIGPMLTPGLREDQGARRRAAGFAVVGFGLAAASLITSGWTRSASPITWQSERGLQIESIPAMPLMFLRTFTDNPSWEINLSEFNALEILPGQPGVALLLKVSTVLTVLSILLACYLSYRLIRNLRAGDERIPEAVVLAILTIVLATIIANKTLSPQYILWLGGPVAALYLHRRSQWLRRHLNVLAVTLVTVGALTQFTYPWGAYGVMANPLGSGPETSVLLIRNVALLVLTGYCLWLTLRSTRRREHPVSV
ncbi:Protein of unknown function [Tessaracoccus bendigoensis DSM 12906]|uniref:DUF2029 domain-containing protein n=1 Tax=Tessaracoccus bendigoensis DSM 12906 TaxID=1123357 RepID=A0A1M6GEW0_9ACTN|nr:glycosyltransferase family 87 protein [Tessaracoccus bendigoensis]SHJ08447.1 Protein of unknown function [Tessaracoccus bendigoensis DSM 12906]